VIVNNYTTKVADPQSVYKARQGYVYAEDETDKHELCKGNCARCQDISCPNHD
jgi:hypothetical protein